MTVMVKKPLLSSHTCLECSLVFAKAKRLSDHIRMAHSLSPVAYVVKHLHSGVVPSCKACGQGTRFVSLVDGFKAYCAEHRSIAESSGGKKGGLAKKHPKKSSPDVSDSHLTGLVSFMQAFEVPLSVLDDKAVSGHVVDVYVPEQKVAVCLVDLSFDSHAPGTGSFDKVRQRERFLACRAAGIKLIQIFSDEWRDKEPIVMSVLANALKKNEHKLSARDCDVEVVTVKESKPFLQRCHVNGSTNASLHYVLRHRWTKEIVACATVRRPIQKKHGADILELARMAFELNTSVRGGASKLLNKITSDIKKPLLSYAELRFGDGGVYTMCGFEPKKEALNNYWYTDGVRRFDRFRFRAQPGKTEKQVAEENNVRPVYGAGNNVFLRPFIDT